MYEKIYKFLDWGVKACSLAITAPATWAVATELFADIPGAFMLFLMRFAAVFLVEGVLLSNWLLLEFDRRATPGIKTRYALSALIMYAGMMAIAWKHEGAIGLVFRGALLLALVGSGWDTYVRTLNSMTARIDRTAEHSPRVKRYVRRLEIAQAKHSHLSNHEVVMQEINLRKSATLQEVELTNTRLVAQVKLDHREQTATLKTREKSLFPVTETGNGKFDPAHARQAKRRKEALKRQRRREYIVECFKTDEKYPRVKMADELGEGTTTLYKEINALIDEGVLVNLGGRAYKVNGHDRVIE